MNTTSPSSHSDRPSTWWRLPLWLVAGFVAAGVLSVTASYAPAVMKRLLIFYVVYGTACGFVLNWLAGEMKPGRNRALPWLAALIGLAGGVNLGLLSYRHFEQGRQQLARERPKDVEILEALRKASENDPEIHDEYARELRKYAPRFDDYLQHRVSSMGDWRSPWPEVFWGFELLLSAAASGITLSILRRQADSEKR